MEEQIMNAIMASKKSIVINGKKVKLPTPQLAGTESQKQAYARMKAREILSS